MRLPRRTRLGLRARITLAFGFGALLLSTLLASVTWGLTREDLLGARDRASVQRVLDNARFLRDKIGPDADVQTAIEGVSRPDGSIPLIRVRGEWRSTNATVFNEGDIQLQLLDTVANGEAARMRYHSGGEPILVVGVAIPTSDALYFERVSLQTLEETLNGLAFILVGAAVVTTIAGFGFGFYASGRTLRPLAEVGAAAQAISDGQLDTRLEAERDPDLQPLIASFNSMVQALQERIERDGRFASEVSHELRSPLMTLTASIEVLENTRDDLPERAQRAVDLLSHDIERFQQLVEDLLEISRFDAGAVRLDLTETFAVELVERTVAALGGSDVPVLVAPDAAEAVVRVDKRRMGQVIANLLDNAHKYAGGAVLVRIDADEDNVRIAVEDEGPGVPPDERDVIFDRFSRGSAGGKRGDDFGTGLGLALIREHVHLHNGRAWTEDRPDGLAGARFVIELPAVTEFDEHTEALDGVPTLDEAAPLDQPDERSGEPEPATDRPRDAETIG